MALYSCPHCDQIIEFFGVIPRPEQIAAGTFRCECGGILEPMEESAAAEFLRAAAASDRNFLADEILAQAAELAAAAAPV